MQSRQSENARMLSTLPPWHMLKVKNETSHHWTGTKQNSPPAGPLGGVLERATWHVYFFHQRPPRPQFLLYLSQLQGNFLVRQAVKKEHKHMCLRSPLTFSQNCFF